MASFAISAGWIAGSSGSSSQRAEPPTTRLNCGTNTRMSSATATM